MQELARLRSIVLISIAAISLASCSQSSEQATGDSPVWVSNDGLLKYVPADTPYLFAKVAPLPDEFADKFEPHFDALLGTYKTLIRAAAAEHSGDDSAENAEKRRRAAAIGEALTELLSVQGLSDAGWERDSTLVLYGSGLVPVLRLTLSDESNFEAAVSKIEQAAERKMETATVGGLTYRYAGDDTARLVIAVLDDEAVLSVVPSSLSDTELRTVLGQTLPSRSIASSGGLREIATEYELAPYAIGFVDVDRVAATFLEDQSGVNAELLALMEYDRTALTDVCKAELRDLANVVPRMIVGYTEINAERMRASTVLELRNDIAAGLMTVAAPVRGLGTLQSGLLSLGMGFDPLALRNFYAARLAAMEADPFECELLADMQAGVGAGGQALNAPIPPIVYDFKGFLAVIDDLGGMDLANDQPPTEIDMGFLIATDNAVGLATMGAMFSPEIAALNLQPNGQPVRLDLPQLAEHADSAFVAMIPDAIAVAVGNGAETRVAEMLRAPVPERSTFLSWDINATRYYEFLEQAMRLAAATDVDTSPEVTEAAAGMMTAFHGLVSRMTLDVRFTERGVEMPYTMTLAD